MLRKERFDQLHRMVASLFLLAIVVWQLLLFGVVMWGLLPPSIDWNSTWENTEKASNALQNIGTLVALIVGGIWTYYLFIKGRVLKPRLELDVSGEIIGIDSKKYIRITVTLKNVGSSKVEITREGFALDVFAQRPSPSVIPEDSEKYKILGIDWTRLLPFDVLTRHQWIEPGETIRDQLLAEILLTGSIAYRIDFVIFASGMRWTATSIVVQPPHGHAAHCSFSELEED